MQKDFSPSVVVDGSLSNGHDSALSNKQITTDKNPGKQKPITIPYMSPVKSASVDQPPPQTPSSDLHLLGHQPSIASTVTVGRGINGMASGRN